MCMMLDGQFVNIVIQIKILYSSLIYALLISTSFIDIPGSEATVVKVDM